MIIKRPDMPSGFLHYRQVDPFQLKPIFQPCDECINHKHEDWKTFCRPFIGCDLFYVGDAWVLDRTNYRYVIDTEQGDWAAILNHRNDTITVVWSKYMVPGYLDENKRIVLISEDGDVTAYAPPYYIISDPELYRKVILYNQSVIKNNALQR